MGAALLGVNSSVANIKSLASTLTADLASAKSDVDSAKSDCSGVTACDNLDTSVLTMDVNFNNVSLQFIISSYELQNNLRLEF